ncbi:hypothetical protein RRG08_000007 [Elysia crispata]|uniref:Cadherin domain-containing protein n=1 Tax=Elysia crispata TaxID=231223 RepID=A0AAE0Y5S2_9GAST|nr:hypothetical protein RRG08_000007 [Elysia crispata]
MTFPLITSLILALFTILGAQESVKSPPCKPRGGYTLSASVSESTAEPGQKILTVDIPGNTSEVTLTANFNEFFAFNSTTREVLIIGTIDAETMKDFYRFNIECQELLFPFSTTKLFVFISIGNANDNSPVFTRDVYTMSIGELTEVNYQLQTPVLATDADNLDDISYKMLSGPYADYFSLGDRRPILTLLKPLDYEKLTTFNLTIAAWNTQVGVSGFELNATCVLQIVVEDEDDQFPMFNNDVYQAYINDTLALNSVVSVRPAISAYDPDKTINSTIVYSFHGVKYELESLKTLFPETDVGQPFTSGPNSQSGDVLTIDPVTAELRLTNRPMSRQLVFLIQATQLDDPMRYGVALLSLQVQGQNVYAPVFSRDDIQVMRTEAFPVGEVIATVQASDLDPGAIVTYSIDEASEASFSVNDNTGDITLISSLDYAKKSQHIITITASDGDLESTGQVTIQVAPINNHPPVIITSSADLYVSIPRRTGIRVADIAARGNNGVVTGLSFKLLTHSNLFAINNQGNITVAASEDDLTLDVYQVAVIVQDNGEPSLSTATVVTINFPKLETPVVAAQMTETDSLLPMILGAVAAVLLIVVIILIVYICKRRSRDKEHLDRAKKQQPSQDAKALAFKKQGTLGKQARVNIEFGEDPSDGETTVQENPLNRASKGGYYNFGQSYSDIDTEVDMNEIQVETSVSPYVNLPARNDNNNNDNIYNHSQVSEESEDYPSSEKQAITSFFRNGTSPAAAFISPLHTYQDSSDSEVSLNASPTDSHDSKKNLVAPSSLARSRVPEEEMANGIHTISSDSDTMNLDPDSSVVPASQKQELTVYF